MLPFTADVFYSVVEQYNRAVWPAHVVAYGLGLAALALALRPVAPAARLIGAILAAAWAWIGVVYHGLHLAAIDFAAPAYGALFVVEALLLGWTAAVRGKLAFRFRAGAVGWTGLGLAILALALYPLIGWLAGHGWPGAPVVGLAPGPTAIFTIGLLLLAEGRTPVHLVAIPVLWSLMGGAAAWVLGVPEGAVLPLAGVGGASLIVWKNRRQTRP